jgi:hypothetical protein
MRDSTLALALFLGQHGRVFTPGPTPENPPKRDLVVKVLEQLYQEGSTMSTDNQPVERTYGGHPLIPSRHPRNGFSSPAWKDGGGSAR